MSNPDHPSPATVASTRAYWDLLADRYQRENRIATDRFHYGPLQPDDEALRLLPEPVEGLRCLEVGCGAGQNSIALARRGARCTALDISEAQIAHGRRLADEAGVEVDWRTGPMERLPDLVEGPFDLIHSAYAVPFTEDPAAMVRTMGGLLGPGGTMILVVGHPLYAGEWLEVDADERGVFLPDYFHPPSDRRTSDDGRHDVCCRFYPVSTWFDWLREAGLTVDRLVEPRPEADAGACAYESEEWRESLEALQKVPMVLVFRAVKANAPHRSP